MESLRKYLTNNFVFNNPYFDYKNTDINSKSIIYIPKGDDNCDIRNYIPCLFIQEYEQSSKFLIFFHGNTEDIFNSELIGQYFSEQLKMNVIIVEYPGYSVYKSEKNAEVMCLDSLIVYDFIKNRFNLTHEDIFVIGRSLGTGPAVYLASKKKLKVLILISPFKSIKSIKGAFIGFFLLDIFKSIDIIDKVTCPIQFIHGKNDTLIDCSHSEELSKLNFNNYNKKDIIPNMTHNEMDLEKDIFEKIFDFLNKLSLTFKKGYFDLRNKQFKNLFDIPMPIQKYFFELNMNLDKPNIIDLTANYFLLLNDERIAVSKINKILVYELEEMEKNIEINTEQIGPTKYLLQLFDNSLAACSDKYVSFYSIKRYKFEHLKTISFSNIIKIEQYNEREIILLTKKALYILNNEYKIIDKFEGNFNNMKIIDKFIVVHSLINNNNNLIEIYNYVNNQFNKLKEYSFKNRMTNIRNNILFLKNKYIVLLDEFELNIIDIENFTDKYMKHNFNNPKYIFELYNDLILIGDNVGNIKVLEHKNENLNTFISKSYYCFNYTINSMKELKDGKLIIAHEEEYKKEIKENDSLNSDGDCICF